jgi:protein-S-isoprenylcysteine O-methyltransferase Ste14
MVTRVNLIKCQMELFERFIMKSIRILPPTYLLCAIIIMVLLHFLFPIAILFTALWNLVGVVFLILGVLININADNTFRITGTTVKPFAESTYLVTSGLYRFSRNPMYLGFVLVLFGVAILSGSLAPFLVVVIFAVLMDREFISVEEQMLAKKFSGEWGEYKGKVRRWT